MLTTRLENLRNESRYPLSKNKEEHNITLTIHFVYFILYTVPDLLSPNEARDVVFGDTEYYPVDFPRYDATDTSINNYPCRSIINYYYYFC
uniref:Uncharacterized protein n=1 Tax=viral metagenome TaxID=1070528 RepID=A0A6C0LVI0_9ZZZZ